ncbi:hypothetical protein BDN72DRAFT_653679, partial [Pluteus cervinus]
HPPQRASLSPYPLNLSLATFQASPCPSNTLKLLTDNPPSREPLLAATGGLPLALTTRVESDLRALEKLRIKPVFVFPGLLPNKRWKQHLHLEHNEACRDRRDAWSKYEGGQEEAATKLFEGRSSFQQWDLWRMILRIFRQRNVEFIIAPYLAWAQVCITTTFFINLFFLLPVFALGVIHSESTQFPSETVNIPPTAPQIIYPCDLRTNRHTPISRSR